MQLKHLKDKKTIFKTFDKKYILIYMSSDMIDVTVIISCNVCNMFVQYTIYNEIRLFT